MKHEEELKRESTGIKEVDGMIEGGFPQAGVVGLSGPPGIGKSIFSLHFILEGAKKGEKSVYINLEEPRKNIDNMINQLDFSEEFYNLEKKGLIIIRCIDYSEYEKINLELLERIGEDKKIKRLVIDSFNCFFSSLDMPNSDVFNVRKLITQSINLIRKNKLTSLLILEKDSEAVQNYNIPYLVDGIIKLDFLDLGIIERRIFIPKMRWTNQYKESRIYDINNTGIVLE